MPSHMRKPKQKLKEAWQRVVGTEKWMLSKATRQVEATELGDEWVGGVSWEEAQVSALVTRWVVTPITERENWRQTGGWD